MQKQLIAFVDHPAHQKTGSADFFVELLEERFDVHRYFLEPDPRALMQEIADAGYELVVCWQTEFCAPYFLLRGLRVVCIPMFDGVEGVPDWYWLPMRQAHFVNFSETLHNRHRRLGIDSLYVKYYGAKEPDPDLAEFEDLHALFWQRRPEEGLDYRFVRKLLGGVANSIHIHNAPDFSSAADWEPDPTCSVSHFDKDGSAYRDALRKANIFVCPRRTEGIGHTLLEAMSRGMCVIANDRPTANEYIVDGYNGLLIDYDRPPRGSDFVLDRAAAEELGRNARESFCQGRSEWPERTKKILFFVSTAPHPDVSPREAGLTNAYFNICRFANRNFDRYLHLLLRLHNRGLRGQEASTIRLREEIGWFARRLPGLRFGLRVVRALRKRAIA